MNKKHLSLVIVFVLVFGFVLGILYAKFSSPTPAFAQSGSAQIKLKWESVANDENGRPPGTWILRAKIPNGWLVISGSSGLTFVPDTPGYQWK